MTAAARNILEAYRKGYRINENGVLFTPKGNIRTLKSYKNRYPNFGFRINKKFVAVNAHQFAAYCFYGDYYFQSGLIVRHLDGNKLNLSKTNIVLGTYKENSNDEPRDKIIFRASQGGKAAARLKSKRKIKTLSLLLQIIEERNYLSMEELSEKYHMHKRTLYYNIKAYKEGLW